jgi:hypothetical protein
MADSVRAFLASLKLEQYVDNFLQNGYDDESSLKTIDEKDLDAMNITLPGHRKRLLQNGPRVVPPPPFLLVSSPQTLPASHRIGSRFCSPHVVRHGPAACSCPTRRGGGCQACRTSGLTSKTCSCSTPSPGLLRARCAPAVRPLS